MANTLPDLTDPNSDDAKTNQRRRRSMDLLFALGREKFLNSRLKKLIEVFFPGKAQTFNEDALQTTHVSALPEQTPELNFLFELLNNLQQTAKKFINNVKNTLQNQITQAQQGGMLSNVAATNISSAIDAAFTESLLNKAILLQQLPHKAQETIDNEINSLQHQKSRKFVEEVRERCHQKPRPSTNKEYNQESTHSMSRNLHDDIELLGAIAMAHNVERNAQSYSTRDQLLEEIYTFVQDRYSQAFETHKIEFNHEVDSLFASIDNDYSQLPTFSVTTNSRISYSTVLQTLKAFINSTKTHNEDDVTFNM